MLYTDNLFRSMQLTKTNSPVWNLTRTFQTQVEQKESLIYNK